MAQPIKYIPIGDKIELNLGPDPEVIFELIKLRAGATTSGCNSTAPTYSSEVDEPGVEIDIRSSVAGWDDHTLYSPAGAELHRQADRPGGPPRPFPATSFPQPLDAKNYDYQTVEYTATVQPAAKANLLYEILQHQGHNAKQNNVTVERGLVQ